MSNVYVVYDPKNGVMLDIVKVQPDKNYIEIDYDELMKQIREGKNCVDPTTKTLIYNDFRDVDHIKIDLMAKLKVDFNNLKNEGMLSKTINKRINSNYTDLMNMQSLLAYMNANNISTTKFRCYDNSFVDITKEELQSMINELIAYGLEIYQRKWAIENAIQTTTDRDTLLKIKWNEELEIVS